MKNRTFSLYAIIGVIIGGLFVSIISSRFDSSEINLPNNQNPISVPKIYAAASISKGTILLLLAVGVIGVLGVSRKKKDRKNLSKNNEILHATNDHGLNEEKEKALSNNP